MKKLKLFITTVIIILLAPTIVNAASGSYSISSSSSVENGSTISVTFNINASKLFYWQAYITYDTSKLQLVSGSTTFQGESNNASSGQSKATKTLKFKTKKTGTAWVAIAMGSKDNNINVDAQEISFSKKTKNITITEKKQQTKEKKTYSSNNYLKSLSIEGYKISPDFNKNTLEYKLELPTDTKKINVIANKEDNNATVSGNGEKTLTEGLNKITIKVTAENGNIKEYIINATVKELDPIEITIDNKKYTLIRKSEQLPKVNSAYTETTIKIGEDEIPALTSEITKYNLVGLKDENGDIKLYIYNNTDNTYSLYEELSFNKLSIIPIETDDKIIIPKNYKKATITIGDKKVTAYKYKNNYPILIGINAETGEKNIYSYDEVENTVQIFKNTDKEEQMKNNELYTYIITGLGAFLIITYLGILINLIKKNKNNNKLNDVNDNNIEENNEQEE